MVENHSYAADLTGLTLDKSYSPTLVYIKSGSPKFEAYNRFIVDPVMVNYDDPSMEELNPDTIAKMQTYFRDSLIQSLRDGGYEVGTRTEPNTLRISMHLSGLKAPNAAANVTNAVVPFSISVGKVTVEAQFREAVSNRLDIVAVAKSQGSRLVNATPWSTWADIETAFDQWAEGIRKAIDKAHKNRSAN
ncbi:DUF3313 domain-containing protein [Neptunomonas phycophila]|uniref:DUF3313 domain-containing protein n=1 Tax=Neptunomonas phycophila TaxID=1572645 RepID=UPI0015B993A5|nr:DUF3313 domain-containing protein [Neptunomonas phycophila]QLE98174.1 DUF3313 domain-containing protein [Neptunomonas phycophila]